MDFLIEKAEEKPVFIDLLSYDGVFIPNVASYTLTMENLQLKGEIVDRFLTYKAPHSKIHDFLVSDLGAAFSEVLDRKSRSRINRMVLSCEVLDELYLLCTEESIKSRTETLFLYQFLHKAVYKMLSSPEPTGKPLGLYCLSRIIKAITSQKLLLMITEFLVDSQHNYILNSLKVRDKKIIVNTLRVLYELIAKEHWGIVNLMLPDKLDEKATTHLSPESFLDCFPQFLTDFSRTVISPPNFNIDFPATRAKNPANRGHDNSSIKPCLIKGLLNLFCRFLLLPLETNLLLTGIFSKLISFSVINSVQLHDVLLGHSTTEQNLLTILIHLANYIEHCSKKDPLFLGVLEEYKADLGILPYTMKSQILTVRRSEFSIQIIHSFIVLQEFIKELSIILLYNERKAQMITSWQTDYYSDS